jgi:hypothetical protein
MSLSSSLRFAFAAAALAALAACASSPQDSYAKEGATPLAGSRLKDFAEGTTLEGKWGAADFVHYYGVGGSAWNKGTGEKAETGSWRIANDQLCVKWAQSMGGAESCYVVLRKGDEVRGYNAKGEPAFTAKYKKGDVNRLAG